MATYTLISSNVLSSSAASVTFSAIPATYTDLVLRISCRKDNAGTSGTYTITANSTNGSSTYIIGTGSTASSTRTSFLRPYTAQSGATSNTFDSTEIYIPNYTGTTQKPVSTFNAQENNDASAWNIQGVASLFNVTSAITSISIANGSGVNFVTNSSFYLYGISNA
jgi:hypothetical protein